MRTRREVVQLMAIFVFSRPLSAGLSTPSPADPPFVPGGSLISPADARLLVSDYEGIAERSPSRLRFVRSIVEGNNYRHASPGSRLTFDTDATSITFNVFYNGLVTRLGGGRNYIGTVLVNGVVNSTFTSPTGETGTAAVAHTVSGLPATMKEVTLVWPYGDGMDLISIAVNEGASVDAGSQPGEKLAVCGDSITHGFNATKSTDTWAYKLAALKNRQLINLGYGSRTAINTDANALIGTGADRVTYMIGYNNFAAQSSVSAFQAQVESWITNARAALPSAKIYLISPIYSPNTNTITLQDYRDAIQAAEVSVGDAETYFVSGLSIMTNNVDRLDDNVHPNDLGSSEIATNLAAIIPS